MDEVAVPLPTTGQRGEERADRWERRFEWPVLTAALLVVPVVVLEHSAAANGGLRALANAVNWLIWLVFAFEFIALLAVTPARADWLRRHPLETAIVLLTPPFLPASFAALRLFRLLRLLRLVFVVKELRRLLTPDGVRLAAVLAGASALGGGAVFADVEKGHSLWDGVWWAVTTMATVGYGDLAPKTVTGRLVALALMFIGVGFFALVTGAIAQRFLAAEVRDVEEAEHELLAAEVEARDHVLAEIRELSDRLRRLERVVQRL